MDWKGKVRKLNRLKYSQEAVIGIEWKEEKIQLTLKC